MSSRYPILRLGETLVVPIEGNPGDQALLAIRQDLLDRIEKTGATGVLLDVSALEVIDSFTARVLGDTAAAVGLMGARTILVGLSPEAVTVLIDLGIRLSRLSTARNLEQGLAMLRKEPPLPEGDWPNA